MNEPWLYFNKEKKTAQSHLLLTSCPTMFLQNCCCGMILSQIMVPGAVPKPLAVLSIL